MARTCNTGQGPRAKTVTGASRPLSSYICVMPTFRPSKPNAMQSPSTGKEAGSGNPDLSRSNTAKRYYGTFRNYVQREITTRIPFIVSRPPHHFCADTTKRTPNDKRDSVLPLTTHHSTTHHSPSVNLTFPWQTTKLR